MFPALYFVSGDMTKTTQGKSPFTTSEITWQMVAHLSNFPCQWLRVFLSPGVCLIRIWLLFLLAENEYRWLRAPKTPYLGFWLWSCLFQFPQGMEAGNSGYKTIKNINLYNYVQRRKAVILVKLVVCPKNVNVRFANGILSHFPFCYSYGGMRRVWFANIFVFFSTNQIKCSVSLEK